MMREEPVTTPESRVLHPGETAPADPGTRAGMNVLAKLTAIGNGGPIARWLPFCLLGFLFIVLLRTAWMSDDAYITLRTVDNFVHGHGLRWNVDERVQAFTHPLWMFLESAFYLVTREAFRTVIFLSIALSMTAAGLLAFRSRARVGALTLGALALLASRAYVDYSTSGLENPLTHLLTVIFLLNLRDEAPDRKRLFLLGAVAGLAALNRVDSLLLFLPGLAFAWGRFGWRRGLPVVLTGFAPLLCWELFSLFYYGLPVPNTALAKLNTGIDGMSLARQGIRYLANSLRTDPVTLPVIAAGLAVAFVGRRRRDVAVALGILCAIAYVVKIGGDFMSGRFLSAPFLASVVLLMQAEPFPLRRGRPALAVIILGLAIATPHPSISSGPGFGVPSTGTLDASGIADERRFYFSMSGLLNRDVSKEKPARRLTRTGREAKRMKSPILVEGMIGVAGYVAGPSVRIVDFHALADPLLARLPIVAKDRMYEAFMIGSNGKKGTGPWRIGHFLRNVPAGYLETVLTGSNRIEDPELAAYYDRLALVTRGPLWSWKRIVEIVRMNLGRYNHLIDRTHPPKFDEIRWEEVIKVRPDAAIAYVKRAEARFDAGDQEAALEDARQAVRIDPQSAEAHILIGRIERDRGDLAGALDAFREARDAAPDFAAAYAHLGDTYMRMGDQARGIDSFKQALRFDPVLSLAFANIAVAYSQLDRFPEAAVWATKAYECSPDNPLICENRGLIELHLGNKKIGLEMLEKAIALQPDLASSISAAGIAYADMGNNRRALELLERAVTLDASDAEAAYRLGLLLFTGGERQRALELWNRAAALGFEPARKALGPGGARP
jgi:arabinofuranosyltransferase